MVAVVRTSGRGWGRKRARYWRVQAESPWSTPSPRRLVQLDLWSGSSGPVRPIWSGSSDTYRDDRLDLGDLVRRWREEGDEEALRLAAQTMLLTPFDLSGPRTRAAFDGLRGELARLFLAASVGEGKDRERAGKVLSLLLAPEPRRGPPPKLAVTQRDAIVASYFAGVVDADVRAERMAELENRILPRSAEHLGWPADLSLDLDSVLRSRSRRKR